MVRPNSSLPVLLTGLFLIGLALAPVSSFGQGNGNSGQGNQGNGNQGNGNQGNGDDDLRQGGGPSGDNTRGQGGDDTLGGPLTSPGGGTFPGGGGGGGQQGGSRSGDQIGPSAGQDIESPVGNAAITRWEAVKKTLRDMMRAYVMQDIGSFMKLFSRNFTQDAGVYRNAVLDDFQNEVNPNIDIELLEYRVNFGTILVRLRWSRNSISAETGNQINTATGEATVLFDRFDGFKLQSWQGAAPFGIRDQQLKTQTRAGQPESPTPTPTPTPTQQPAGPTTQSGSVQFNLQSFVVDAAFIDLENSSFRTFNVEGPETPTATEDLKIQLLGANLEITEAAGADNHNRCDSVTALSQLRTVLPAQFQDFTLLTQFPAFLSVRTREGNFAFLRIERVGGGQLPAQVTVTWTLSSSATVNPSGTTDCVTVPQ